MNVLVAVFFSPFSYAVSSASSSATRASVFLR